MRRHLARCALFARVRVAGAVLAPRAVGALRAARVRPFPGVAVAALGGRTRAGVLVVRAQLAARLAGLILELPRWARIRVGLRSFVFVLSGWAIFAVVFPHMGLEFAGGARVAGGPAMSVVPC